MKGFITELLKGVTAGVITGLAILFIYDAIKKHQSTKAIAAAAPVNPGMTADTRS